MPFNMTPLRDYTEQELMALPADSRLLFADNLNDGILTYDPTEPLPHSHRRRRILQTQTTICDTQLSRALSKVSALRCISHGLSAFSLYPTTDQQYNVNKFLWRAANTFSFDASEAAILFQRNVFIISMPATLFDYLTSVTWLQLENALLYTLTNLANGSNGLHVLRDELAPSLAERLDDYMPDAPYQTTCDPFAFRLMLDLVMDRIVSMGPWIVSTTLCYLSASDMTELLAQRYERPIFSTPENFELVHTMMWNIYRDWQTYRHILVNLGGRSRLEALEIMAHTISKGTQCLVDEGIRTLLQIASDIHVCDDISFGHCPSHPSPSINSSALTDNFLSLLPTDVILGKLIPKLCDAYAVDDKYRRRTIAPTPVVEVASEPSTPVSVPFSLKHLVLEDHTLLQLYRSSEADDDIDMSDIDDQEGDFDMDPDLEPEGGAAGLQEPEADVEPVAESPRSRRRRPNEQGSFQRGANQMGAQADVGDVMVEVVV